MCKWGGANNVDVVANEKCENLRNINIILGDVGKKIIASKSIMTNMDTFNNQISDKLLIDLNNVQKNVLQTQAP